MINGSRTLILKFEEEYEREIWFNIISQKVKEYQTSLKNVFNSFANEKQFCNARWFVDADSYYSDLYDSLMSANETIYIAGWWVSPELFLKRPVSMEMYSEYRNKPVMNGVRLMDVLMRKAENNVKIHILVFKEVTLAVAIDSSHTKDIFNNLHPNIKVTRHPKNKTDLLWSHHEKVVIIDEEIGYVGGIDLCWGRYDTREHKLSELPNDGKVYTWPGIDYSNNRIKDFQNLREYHKEIIDRGSICRMPWHDIHVRLEGPVVSDLCRHFVERWNYARMTITGTFTKEKKHTIVKCIYFY
jgi:phospholipase D1/2